MSEKIKSVTVREIQEYFQNIPEQIRDMPIVFKTEESDDLYNINITRISRDKISGNFYYIFIGEETQALVFSDQKIYKDKEVPKV